jgi:Yip1 domain
MALEAPPAPKGSGLKNAVDIVIAPKEALEQIRVAPTWGWAYLIAVVICVAVYYAYLPVTQHAMAGDFAKQVATNPQLAALTPEQQQTQLGVLMKLSPFFSLFTPIAILIFVLIQTVIMLIFNAAGRGKANFGTLWASSINISIIYALGQIVQAVVAVVRGPDAFNSASELQRAIPSLALVAPNAGIKLVAFLGTINPFNLWSAFLVVMAMTIVARVPKVQAWLAGILSFLVPALLAVAFAK